MRGRVGVVTVLLCLNAVGCSDTRPNDYQVELRHWDAQIAAAASELQRTPGTGVTLQLIYLRYSRAALTGDPAEFAALYTSLLQLSTDISRTREVQLLLVKLEYQLHRFPQARARLAQLGPAPEDSELRALAADLAAQAGDYQQARQAYAQIVRGRSAARWDQLARHAHLQAILGERAQAEQSYQQAAELLTAKQIRHYAWLEVQLGALALRHGQLDAAEQHYRRAERAYSGYWLVADHLAELTAIRGDLRGALEQYRRIEQQWPRPDLQRALGDVYSQLGDPARARQWHQRAQAGYMASVQRGEVHYLHHLADFHADVTRDGTAAVAWARKDLQLRQGFSAHDTLAWALYRDGQFTEALQHSVAALAAAGDQDTHVLRHAALIHASAGHSEAGTRLLQRAGAINPRGAEFHVHR